MTILDHQQIEEDVRPTRAATLIQGLKRLIDLLHDCPSLVEGDDVVPPTAILTLQCTTGELAQDLVRLLADYPHLPATYDPPTPGYTGGKVALASYEDKPFRRAVVINVWGPAPKCEACGR